MDNVNGITMRKNLRAWRRDQLFVQFFLSLLAFHHTLVLCVTLQYPIHLIAFQLSEKQELAFYSPLALSTLACICVCVCVRAD